ncbi:Hypothetical predicted protein [Olea europaea subsp. europaea]|uniref:Uncharacterized protein n=1 Tax=Olea europaea subsp. europaea TaxID=158383 RepID=A0A8S0SGB4_OLEEU|nr:Hypothetical predicted protein [Olea europaea subsp. europaea]
MRTPSGPTSLAVAKYEQSYADFVPAGNGRTSVGISYSVRPWCNTGSGESHESEYWEGKPPKPGVAGFVGLHLDLSVPILQDLDDDFLALLKDLSIEEINEEESKEEEFQKVLKELQLLEEKLQEGREFVGLGEDLQSTVEVGEQVGGEGERKGWSEESVGLGPGLDKRPQPRSTASAVLRGFFYVSKIIEDVWQRLNGQASVRSSQPSTSRIYTKCLQKPSQKPCGTVTAVIPGFFYES